MQECAQDGARSETDRQTHTHTHTHTHTQCSTVEPLYSSAVDTIVTQLVVLYIERCLLFRGTFVHSSM